MSDIDEKYPSGARGQFADAQGRLPPEYFKVLDIISDTVIPTSEMGWAAPSYNSRPLAVSTVSTFALNSTWQSVLSFDVPDRHVVVIKNICATIAGDMAVTPVEFRLRALKRAGYGDWAVNFAPGSGMDRFKHGPNSYPCVMQPMQIVCDQENPIIIQARYAPGASVRLLCAITGIYYKTNELTGGRGSRTGIGNW